ncbi:hypothetical protein AVEN_209256-1 [Araneus ventricosus]|uniref:Uncharacterized protein n=1 Tax=Araneus ventricosus TaxID=182803 RepID=A0A4Y2S9B9_ARAVE|nr:hypothetical protein AVEN_209256-1 [Araneus ventricosus]
MWRRSGEADARDILLEILSHRNCVQSIFTLWPAIHDRSKPSYPAPFHFIDHPFSRDTDNRAVTPFPSRENQTHTLDSPPSTYSSIHEMQRPRHSKLCRMMKFTKD